MELNEDQAREFHRALIRLCIDNKSEDALNSMYRKIWSNGAPRSLRDAVNESIAQNPDLARHVLQHMILLKLTK